MATEAKASSGTAKKLFEASKSFQASLKDILKGQQQLQKIEMHVTAQAFGGSTPKSECIVVIIGDDSDAAKKHCEDMTKQGCSCVHIGILCSCDCKDVPEH